jgi:hypothetical protein
MPLLTVSSSVPEGSYTGVFDGVEVQRENKEKGYGPGLRWKWKVDAGPYAGQSVSRITGATPNAQNAAGKILMGLLGRQLKDGEQIDPDALKGKRYILVLQAAEGRATRVESVVAM